MVEVVKYFTSDDVVRVYGHEGARILLCFIYSKVGHAIDQSTGEELVKTVRMRRGLKNRDIMRSLNLYEFDRVYNTLDEKLTRSRPNMQKHYPTWRNYKEMIKRVQDECRA